MFDTTPLSLPRGRTAYAVSAGASTVRALLVVGQAFFLASAVVSLYYGASFSSQAGAVAAFLACFVAQHIAAAALDAYLSRYAADRAADLRDRLLSTLFSRGPAVMAGRGTGGVSAAVVEGVDSVEEYLKLIIPKTTSLLIVPPVLFAVSLPADWVSALIMLVAFPAIVFYMVLLGKNARDAADARHAEFDRLSNHFVDSLRGLTTLKLFGRSRAHGRAIFEVSERFREATMRTLRIATLSSAVLDLAATLALAAVAIMLGFRMVEGSVAFLPALFVLVVVPEYFKPIREFAADYHASLDGKTALAGILDIVAEGEGAGVGSRAPRADGSHEPGSVAPAGASPERFGGSVAVTAFGADAPAIAPWGASSTLELSGVRFAYPGAARPALSDVGFSVRGPRKVGIVGASGSGKSTLVTLLAGFSDPDAGTVAVDGASLGGLHVPSWQGQAVYIPQSPYIFSATLRDNIAFYAPDASERDIERAVRAMGLERLVDELSDGLDTRIGEGGRAVSGGERQRIALARALLDGGRRILLFDEPTAHLDIESELELKERMLPLMEGRLVFFATHRLHWAADMDDIAVVDAGRLAYFGPADAARQTEAFVRLAAQTERGLR